MFAEVAIAKKFERDSLLCHECHDVLWCKPMTVLSLWNWSQWNEMESQTARKRHSWPMPTAWWANAREWLERWRHKQHFKSFTTHMWICIHIFIIFICTYVDGDTCDTCFHCQSSLNPGSLMGCALVADFLPGRIEVGQWGLKNFGGEWWSPWSGGTAMNVGHLLLMHHVSIPTDQAAALVTIGEIYSMNGKKDEAKKARLIFFAVTDRTCYRALQFGHARLIGCWLSVKSYLNLSHPFISFRFAMIFNIAFYRTPGTVTCAVCTQVSGHRSEDPRSSEWRCCTVPCLVCGV